jgi:hypothetical protein
MESVGLGQNRGTLRLRFSATLEPRRQAAAIVLDDEQVAAVEGAKRFPVVATAIGFTWRTTPAACAGNTCWA